MGNWLMYAPTLRPYEQGCPAHPALHTYVRPIFLDAASRRKRRACSSLASCFGKLQLFVPNSCQNNSKPWEKAAEDASGTHPAHPFLQLLSCGTRPGRVRGRSP
eukprot:gene8681-biopygen16651